jgi:hypothetical protein
MAGTINQRRTETNREQTAGLTRFHRLLYSPAAEHGSPLEPAGAYNGPEGSEAV